MLHSGGDEGRTLGIPHSDGFESLGHLAFLLSRDWGTSAQLLLRELVWGPPRTMV